MCHSYAEFRLLYTPDERTFRALVLSVSKANTSVSETKMETIGHAESGEALASVRCSLN